MDMAPPPLPDDIIRTNILTRLEVKYVLRFRSVCKSWNSFISENSFIKDHLNCTTRKCSNLIFKKHVYKIDHDRNTTRALLGNIAILSLSDLSETRLVNTLPFCRRNNIHMLGSTNGLVCLFYPNIDKFILWNPAIRQAMKIDSPITHFMLRDVTPAFFGLCWDAMENDYKVVNSYYMRGTGDDDRPRLRSSYIYSCNSGSWSLLPNFKPYGRFWFLAKVQSAIVNGIPYWEHYSAYGQNIHLIKFDVGSKEFRWLPELEVASEHARIVVNLKECLCALVCEAGSSHTLVDVHCFDERCGVWIKKYNFRVPRVIDRVLSCFKYGGELVFEDQHGTFCCYDPGTDKIMDLDNQDRLILKCFSYSESLIFLKGMKPQHQVEPALWTRAAPEFQNSQGSKFSLLKNLKIIVTSKMRFLFWNHN